MSIIIPRFAKSNYLTNAALIIPGNDTTSSYQELSYPIQNTFDSLKELSTRTVYRTFVIAASKNDALDYYDGAVKAITLTPGQYYGVELASHIESLLGQNFSCTYNATTGKFTIARSGGTFELLLLTNRAGTPVPAFNRSHNVGATLGFDCSQDAVGSAAGTTTYTSKFASYSTGGRFIIDTTNNKLQLGATLVTLTQGTYSAKSLCTMLDHVCNNTVSPLTRTNGYNWYYDDLTNKFKAKRNTTAPTFSFENAATTVEDTLGWNATSQAPGASTPASIVVPFVDSVDLYTTADNRRIMTSWEMVIDAGTGKTFGALSVLALYSNVSPTATVKMQFNSSNVWTSPAFNKTLLYNANVLLAGTPASVFTLDSYATAPDYRFGRLEITDKDNPAAYLEVGLWFGGAYEALSSNYSYGKVEGREAMRNINMSGSGHVRGSKIFYPKRFTWPLDNKYQADFDKLDLLHTTNGDFIPFLLLEDVESNQYTKTLWMRLNGPLPDFSEGQAIARPWSVNIPLIESR